MNTVPLYRGLAQLRAAIERCENASVGTPARDTHLSLHEQRFDRLMAMLPSGSGFDAGVKLVDDECKSNRLVLKADFHHMTEHGMYDGWTEHKVIVTPSLADGAVIRITGRDRKLIREYIADVMHEALNTLVDPFAI